MDELGGVVPETDRGSFSPRHLAHGGSRVVVIASGWLKRRASVAQENAQVIVQDYRARSLLMYSVMKKTWSSGVTMFVGLGLAAALAAGCSAEQGPREGDESALDDADPGMSIDDVPTGTVSSELSGCGPCNNCVLYARCRQPRLPYGLTSYADKVRQINGHTPHAGCVAVIKTSSYYGHVAYVNGVSGSTVHIDEGNWSSGHCGTRAGTAAALNVAGYICP